MKGNVVLRVIVNETNYISIKWEEGVNIAIGNKLTYRVQCN